MRVSSGCRRLKKPVLRRDVRSLAFLLTGPYGKSFASARWDSLYNGRDTNVRQQIWTAYNEDEINNCLLTNDNQHSIGGYRYLREA